MFFIGNTENIMFCYLNRNYSIEISEYSHGSLKIRTDILPFVGLKTRPIIFCIIYFKRDTFSCIIDTVIVQKNLIYFPIIGIALHTSDNFYSKSKDKMNSIETRTNDRSSFVSSLWEEG